MPEEIHREFNIEVYGQGHTLEECLLHGQKMVQAFIESENLDVEKIIFTYGKAEETDSGELGGRKLWQLHITAQVTATLTVYYKVFGLDKD